MLISRHRIHDLTKTLVTRQYNLFVVLLGLLCILFFNPVAAEEVQTKKKVYGKNPSQEFPMPKIPLLNDNEFDDLTVTHKISPFKESLMSYEVNLPKDWTNDQSLSVEKFDLSQNIVGDIGIFYGPVHHMSERSKFLVEGTELKYQITAEQWLYQNLVSNGFSIQGFKTYDNDRAEALYVRIQNAETFIIRKVAINTGKNIISGEHILPVERWENERVLQASITNSFRLNNPSKEMVEKFKKYTFLDIAYIQYPESWQLRAPALRSVDRMSVELLNIPPEKEYFFQEDDYVVTLNGKIDASLVSAYSARSLEDELDKIKKNITEKGLTLGEQLEVDYTTFEFNELFEFANIEIYEAVDKNQNVLEYEFWIALMAAGDYYYFTTLLTPSRTENYTKWARNTQTFKLVLKLLTPQEIN